MGMFICTKCHVIENTSLAGYYRQKEQAQRDGDEFKPLCSQCDPHIGVWHDQFNRIDGRDLEIGDGFLILSAKTG